MTTERHSPDVESAMSRTIALVRNRFVQSLDEKILDFEDLMLRLRAKTDRDTVLAAIRDEAHKTAGIAETIGLPAIGDQAAKIENLADVLIARQSGDEEEEMLEIRIEIYLSELEDVLDSEGS